MARGKITCMKKILLLLSLCFGAFAFCPVPAFSQEAAENAVKESVWEKMFPEGLLAKASQKSSAANKNTLKKLEGKFVGIYHSANWCGYCHKFTPQLIKFYKKNKKDFEVVFVSGDKTEKQMQKYAKSAKMPWLAAPFEKENGAPKARGYPCLHVLTPDGKAFTTISGANTKEKEDSRLHEELRAKMDRWLKENTEK